MVFVGIGFIYVLTTYGAQRANKVLDRRFVNITSYLQMPILYLVDVLWFDNGIPGLFEILGSTLFFIVLIVKSLLEPVSCSNVSTESPDEQRALLQESVLLEDYNEEERKNSRGSKKINPGGGYYGSN